MSNLVNFNIIIVNVNIHFSVEPLVAPLVHRICLEHRNAEQQSDINCERPRDIALDDYTSTLETMLNQSDLRTGRGCYHDIIQAYYWIHNCYIVIHRFNPHCYCTTLFLTLSLCVLPRWRQWLWHHLSILSLKEAAHWCLSQFWQGDELHWFLVISPLLWHHWSV